MIEVEVQKAIYSALALDPEIELLVGDRIYDRVPQADDSGSQAAFPYVVIGDDTFLEWSTDTEIGWEVTARLHVWSRYGGRLEVKKIQGAIFAVLDRKNLTVSGYNFVTCDFLESSSVLEVDGETRHGIQSFRLLTQEN